MCIRDSITSNVSSMPEVAGDAALLVDPYDISSIADAMSLITSDKNLRSDFVVKGKLQRVKFSWKESAAIIYRELSKLV